MSRDFPHAVSALADVAWTVGKPGWVLFLDVDVYLHQKVRFHVINQTIDDCLLSEAIDILSDALALTRLAVELMGTGFLHVPKDALFSASQSAALVHRNEVLAVFLGSSSHCADVFLPI